MGFDVNSTSGNIYCTLDDNKEMAGLDKSHVDINDGWMIVGIVCDTLDDAEMNGRFLFMMSIPREWRIVRNISLMRRLSLLYRYRNYRGELRHPNIRNYEEIMFSSLSVQPQIVQVVEGPNDYTSCIIKTTYIRQLQRRWKKMYAERQRVLKERKNPMEQVKRQISGKYTSRWK